VAQNIFKENFIILKPEMLLFLVGLNLIFIKKGIIASDKAYLFITKLFFKLMNTESKVQKLKNKIKKGLIPNPHEPGKFIEPSKDPSYTKLKHLAPNNWIFHPQIVKKVLEGKYQEIMPYSGEFVTTLNCSNRCIFPCSYVEQRVIEGIPNKNEFKNSRTHMQSFDFAKELLDKIIEAGVKGIIFTGGGEPFLFRRLEDLIAYSTEKGLDSVLYTNGNSVSENRIEKTIEANPLLVRVSLNAGTQEVYNKLHNPFNPKKAFQRALNTIELLAKGSLQNPKIDTGVGVIINKINRGDLVESAKRIREIVDKTGGGISYAAYRPAYNHCGHTQLSPEFLDSAHKEVETKVRPILEQAGISVSNITCRYEALKKQREYNTCRASGLYFELSPSGQLHTCSDRNCHAGHVIGDLTKNTLAEVWTGKSRNERFDYINSTYCDVCAPGCKPHETNIQFDKIEKLRNSGEFYKVELWIKEQQKMPKPKMVNF